MKSVGHNTASRSEPISDQFEFISVQGPDVAKDKTTKRLARSHAVKQALKNKRILQNKSGDNFRAMTPQTTHSSRTQPRNRPSSLNSPHHSISADALDPFDTLAVDFSKLQLLLGNEKARQAPEPVFSVAKELAFQNFHSVFRTGLLDPALTNAVMLSVTFAVTGGRIDLECLGYQGQAISRIRQKIVSLDESSIESTIGAILLLAGVEASLGLASQVQLHMSAIQHLLKTCREKGIYLTCGIKRAIFWQDLNASILSGSTRIVDHTTFAELQWTRDTFSPNFFQLPVGLQKRSHLFSEEFTGVLEDVQALRCVRDVPGTSKGDVMLMAYVNNHIASIQSRLANLSNLAPAMECCRLTAYLCSIVLCCKIWCGLVIPSHISSSLLRGLQSSSHDLLWDNHPDLLLWILCIGGAFAPSVAGRSGYATLLRSNRSTRFRDSCRSWSEVLRNLQEFIWSEAAFTAQVKEFWMTSLAS